MPQLEFQQFLPVSPEEAWDFFSTPINLNRITPPEMNFIIRSALPEKAYTGLIIVYTVSPFTGIPLTWVTEITHIREHYRHPCRQVAGQEKNLKIFSYREKALKMLFPSV